MRLFRNLLYLLLFFTGCNNARAQFPAHDYPVNYFRSPMAIPLNLSGNFGELRANHFHMGLDIRTNQRENLPVFAAAEGFISRVKIEKRGYGRAIYIDHPNGFTTLYAHLNDFYKELNDYIKEQQYSAQQWEQYILLPAGRFPVEKGQFIASSGNTGGSQGPHLHFEIRETITDKNINPLYFNFNIPDHIAPVVYGLYYYDRRSSTYHTSPGRIPLKGTPGNLTSADNVVRLSSPVFSLGISAEDKTDRSFKFGIYQTELWVDDTLRNAFRMNDFSYDDSRYINANIDYRYRYGGGGLIQHLSVLPGNSGPVYLKGAAGVINIGDTAIHNIRISIQDVSGNTTTIRLRVKYAPSATVKRITPLTNDQYMIPSQPNTFSAADIEVHFSDLAFYDTLAFRYSAQEPVSPMAVSRLHTLHNYTIPVHDSFTVSIKMTRELPGHLKERVVMQLVNERKKVAMKGSVENDWMEAKFWDLGKVQLILDTFPPVVRPVGWKNGADLRKIPSITLFADDGAGDIKSFRAEMDGEWIMFSRKSDYFIHRFDERTAPGPHELKVLVTDEAGNETEKIYRLIR